MLKELLQETKEKAKINLPQEVSASFDQMIEELRQSSLLEKMPKVGDILPPFILTNAMGAKISSEDYLNKGLSLIISFYRGAWLSLL